MISWFGGKIMKVHEKNNTNVSAFSMVELLVVVSILAIISSIAVPVYLNQRSKAHKSAAAVDAASWGAQVAEAVAPYASLGPPESIEVYPAGSNIVLDVPNSKIIITLTQGSTPESLPLTIDVPTNITQGSTIKTFDGAVENGYIGYGVLKAWCFIVQNNNQSVVVTQAGELPNETKCPNPGQSRDPVVPLNVPSAPAVGVAVAGTNGYPVAGFNVTWVYSGTVPADTWTVKYKLSGQNDWTVAGQYPTGTTTTTVTGLQYYRDYEIEVAGSNSAGQGNWGSAVGNTGRFTPQAPSVGWALDCSTVNFTWPQYNAVFPATESSTFNGGSPITEIRVRYKQTGTSTWSAWQVDTTLVQPFKLNTSTFVNKTASYDYELQSRNAVGYSSTVSGQFNFNNPTFTLPAPPKDPVANWPTVQATRWTSVPSERKNFIFNVPTPAYTCPNIPVSSYEIATFADGQPYGSVVTVANGATAVITGTGDRNFTFSLRAFPTNTALGPTPWSEQSTPILSVPNPPSTQSLNTWEWGDRNSNEAAAKFYPPTYYRPQSEFKIVVESNSPSSATDTGISGLTVNNNDSGRVKKVLTGAKTVLSDSVTPRVAPVQDSTMTSIYPGFLGGNPVSTRGNEVTNWNTYSSAETALQCGSPTEKAFCQTMILNGTTNYYYHVVARNASGESWSTAELSNPNGPAKVGVRSLPERPYKPKLAAYAAFTDDPHNYGKAYAVWGFETSDTTQRKFLTGYNNISGAPVVSTTSTNKVYRYSYDNIQRNTLADMSYVNISPSWTIGQAFYKEGSIKPAACVDATVNRSGTTVLPRAVPNDGSINSNNLSNCLEGVKVGQGYKNDSSMPGWAFTPAGNTDNDWLQYVNASFKVRACNMGLAYNSSTKVYSAGNTAAQLQCAESIPNSPTFTARKPLNYADNPYNPSVTCPRCVEQYVKSNAESQKIFLWNNSDNTNNLSRNMKTVSFQYSGYIQWYNSAQKVAARNAFPGVDLGFTTTCNYNNFEDRTGYANPCSKLINVPSENSNELALERELVISATNISAVPPRNRADTGAATFPAVRTSAFPQIFWQNQLSDKPKEGWGIICDAGGTFAKNGCKIPSVQYSAPITGDSTLFTTLRSSYYNGYTGIRPIHALIKPPVGVSVYGTQSYLGENHLIAQLGNVPITAENNPNMWWYERTRLVGDEGLASSIAASRPYNLNSYPATGGPTDNSTFCSMNWALNRMSDSTWRTPTDSCGVFVGNESPNYNADWAN